MTALQQFAAWLVARHPRTRRTTRQLTLNDMLTSPVTWLNACCTASIAVMRAFRVRTAHKFTALNAWRAKLAVDVTRHVAHMLAGQRSGTFSLALLMLELDGLVRRIIMVIFFCATHKAPAGALVSTFQKFQAWFLADDRSNVVRLIACQVLNFVAAPQFCFSNNLSTFDCN